MVRPDHALWVSTLAVLVILHTDTGVNGKTIKEEPAVEQPPPAVMPTNARLTLVGVNAAANGFLNISIGSINAVVNGAPTPSFSPTATSAQV